MDLPGGSSRGRECSKRGNASSGGRSDLLTEVVDASSGIQPSDRTAPIGAHVTLGLLAHPLGAILLQNRSVATLSIRQRVSLPARIAKRVLALAETKKTSASRVLVDLIETGLQAKEAQHQRFFEITDRLAETSDPAERKRLQEELARMTFAE
jgi:hypothetical protein